MKRILPAIALFAGLSLVGCTGGGDKPDQADSGGDSSQAPAEETPQASKLDEAKLKEILESTKAEVNRSRPSTVPAIPPARPSRPWRVLSSNRPSAKTSP